AKDWDVETIIEKCSELGYEGVELRTTHRHGVEVSLSKTERQKIREKFDDSPVKLVGLGSAFEYHSPVKEELKTNIEGTKEYVRLAQDVGAEGIKVRPNAFPKEVSQEKAIEQIGFSLRECGQFAKDYGIKIRLEVHGIETCHVPYIKQMIDICDDSNVYVCWNSNPTDIDKNGSIKKNLDLVKDKIDIVHMSELWTEYPYEELFSLLKDMGYEDFCLAEIPESPEPDRILRYYKKL
ncbi:unnamed protein product, partial [marine sediment metagenome]